MELIMGENNNGRILENDLDSSRYEDRDNNDNERERWNWKKNEDKKDNRRNNKRIKIG